MAPPQHQHAPVIVSSHPQQQYQSTPLMRPHVPTPPLPLHSPYSQMLPQPLPSTPSVASMAQASPVPSARSEVIATPPPSSTASRPSTANDMVAPQLASEPEQGDFSPKFKPPLPWCSWHSVAPLALLPAARRRGPRKAPQSQSEVLELPSQGEEAGLETSHVSEAKQAAEQAVVEQDQEPADEIVADTAEAQSESQTSTLAAPSEQETPPTSHAPSENDSETPSTPSALQPVQTPTHSHNRTATRPVVPIIPKVPTAATPKASPSSRAPGSQKSSPQPTDHSPSSGTDSSTTLMGDPVPEGSPESLESQPKASPPVKAAPKSWADLMRKPGSASSAPAVSSGVNGVSASGSPPSSKTSLAEAMRSFSVDSVTKFSFLKPRGLENTGNMCYMNSVLQALVYCVPFYDFLDIIRRRAAHQFKSETPLLDAMILFAREFPIIDSAESADKLKLRLKSEELEQYGPSFTPKDVYEAIKRIPRFADMKRGHQQDAEEFLNKLLQTLDDESAKVINTLPASDNTAPVSPISERSSVNDSGWQEVGQKQKASTTRASGNSAVETPITKIFAFSARSEVQIVHTKTSITTQPYQQLQLDIAAPACNNIVNALKNWTQPETVYGDFNTDRGSKVSSAKKQSYIETLPPVLILHLKRFEFDNSGAQKIWKKVGYPLELTLPKDVFPQSKRAQMTLTGLPKFRLDGVIYHHGQNASSGHYTVDVRRQEGHEWIRIDDKVIRRIRSEDVAEGGAEEDPKALVKALEQQSKDKKVSNNLFDQFGAIDDDEEGEAESGWNTAGNSKEPGTKNGTKKAWSAVANGTATPNSAGTKTPTSKKDNSKDSKVAYILFYRRI
ncbi:hypothetical protein BLS_002846 [Venturia inaequalis]|nr:hypothetical protein BLS_002846 [Venturia inaequalis]KAE9991867.1 hypothetical protein EG327_010745 [Venturia inaequalis]